MFGGGDSHGEPRDGAAVLVGHDTVVPFDEGDHILDQAFRIGACVRLRLPPASRPCRRR
jgi:hypothetical protein